MRESMRVCETGVHREKGRHRDFPPELSFPLLKFCNYITQMIKCAIYIQGRFADTIEQGSSLGRVCLYISIPLTPSSLYGADNILFLKKIFMHPCVCVCVTMASL